MRTFKFDLGLEFKTVVPEQFTQTMREAAKDDDASAFLKKCQHEFPDDDEGFTLAILKNGIRKHVRQNLMEHLQKSGIGGTFAPARLEPIDISHLLNVVPVLATDIDQALQEGTVE